MHSSRMRTDRRLTVSGRGGGIVCLAGGGGGGGNGQTPPTERMTHARENITFPNTTYAVGNNGHSL